MIDGRDRPDAVANDEVRTGWEPGEEVSHRYALDRRLGRGSTGEVWLAEDRLLRKQVALKVLDPQLAQSRDTVRRFLREVALAHSVTHRNVVRIFDTGEADRLPFFAMEYLQGKTLEELLSQHDGRIGERLTFPEIREIAVDVLDGMKAAHRVGVIHRDLKPGNVMLTHRGAIVMDFGVAGIEELSENPNPASARSLVSTEAGTLFGSPAYMAPELWEGEPATVQSDLYAFGVMVYQMVTGRLPYEARSAVSYIKQLNAGPPPSVISLRRDTPWGIARLVRRCMATDPRARPASAAAAANQIAPLRDKMRRRWVVGSTALAATALGVYLAQTPPDDASLGLSPGDLPDLRAGVSLFDAGEHAAALRHLARLRVRDPQSAALGFWQAMIQADLGEESGRRHGCQTPAGTPVSWTGSSRWRSRVSAICEVPPRWPTDFEDALVQPGRRSDEILPLVVQTHLLPRLESTREAQDDARAIAREVLGRLEHPPPPARFTLPIRWDLARIDVELALGRVAEATQHLDDSLARAPHTPVFMQRAGWLALEQGRLERARPLAQRLASVDPTLLLRLQMVDGRMASAWSAIEAGEGEPGHARLVEMWCGYAWRFEIDPWPVQCRDLHPSLVRALWLGEPESPSVFSARELAIASLERAVRGGACSPPAALAATLTHAPAPFELRHEELAVEAALCAHDPDHTDLDEASRRVARLAAVASGNPWVALLQARVDEARGESDKARMRRSEVSQRWRHADPSLPLVSRVRVQVGEGR